MDRKLDRKVLLVGIDGLILNRALTSGRAPTLKNLSENGFFVETVVDLPTISGPSWSTLLTGKRLDVHKVIDNYFIDHNLAAAPDFLTQALDLDESLITYAAAGWPPLIDPEDVGPVIAKGKHLRFHRDGETNGYIKVDKEVHDHALETLREVGPDLSFVYFCGVDEAGHKHGALSDEYLEAIERIDGYVAQLHDALESRATSNAEQWLIILVTDHGHRDEGGHGGDSPQERASFIIAYGIGRAHPNWSQTMKPHELTPMVLNEIFKSKVY